MCPLQQGRTAWGTAACQGPRRLSRSVSCPHPGPAPGCAHIVPRSPRKQRTQRRAQASIACRRFQILLRNDVLTNSLIPTAGGCVPPDAARPGRQVPVPTCQLLRPIAVCICLCPWLVVSHYFRGASRTYCKRISLFSNTDNVTLLQRARHLCLWPLALLSASRSWMYPLLVRLIGFTSCRKTSAPQQKCALNSVCMPPRTFAVAVLVCECDRKGLCLGLRAGGPLQQGGEDRGRVREAGVLRLGSLWPRAVM